MRSLDGRPNNQGPQSLMKNKFIRCAVDYGVFNPASTKKHKLDKIPQLIKPARSDRELRHINEIGG